MGLNLSDSDNVMAAYESILQNEFNWLLLHYANANDDELSLLAYGLDGLEELKTKIYDKERVFIAFYREEVDVNPRDIIINYIPLSISGVKRARALVHSRRVGAMLKSHQTTMTVEDLSQLTNVTIDQALSEPDSSHILTMGRSFSQPSDKATSSKPLPKPISLEPVRRSFSETYAPHTIPPPPPPQAAASSPKGGSMFTSLLRRKRRTEDSSTDRDESPPPPTPPKDKGKFSVQQPYYGQMSTQVSSYSPKTSAPKQIPQRPLSNNLAEFAVISSSFSSDEVIVESPHTPAPPKKDTSPGINHSMPLRGKWASETSPLFKSPEERARRRLEAQRQREREEAEAVREEERRQAELKRQREQFLREEIEEETRRRASVERELKWITAERRRKEQLEREEEERKRREIEERKRLDKERRLEEHRKLEEWRKEQARLADEAARRTEEERRVSELERRKKIQLVEAQVKGSTKADELLTGWVTMQLEDSVVWKRRFYKFSGNTMYLYRSSKDLNQALDELPLKGQLRGLKEWNEGYDDLEAIAFSFAIEFKDQRGAWSMFADSEEEKFKLLGLLHHAAGL
ncbi:hypothetical protein BDQ12DRAFT_51114 [Crucibulum laeve]|uniref:ADF-H domain-containing protein n=1 Tax=Crucibulum laeve TaxID=68775 RepID=A0A5C3M1S9_9AGAR|nr:hypothetical protein BDQ12DRAFT_51114 [Crucibulum laeve]